MFVHTRAAGKTNNWILRRPEDFNLTLSLDGFHKLCAHMNPRCRCPIERCRALVTGPVKRFHPREPVDDVLASG